MAVDSPTGCPAALLWLGVWVRVQVVAQHPDMPGADVAAMYAALLAFCGTGALLLLLAASELLPLCTYLPDMHLHRGAAALQPSFSA